MLTIRPIATSPFQLMNALLSPDLSFGGVQAATGSVPTFLVREEPTAFIIEADLPGVAPGDLELSVKGSEVTLRAHRAESSGENGSQTHRRERWSGGIERTIDLGAPVDADRTSASLVNGLLTVTLPKPASAQPRRIPVSLNSTN